MRSLCDYFFNGCVFQCELPFPDTGIVYDYRLDDAGISSSDDDESLDEETEVKKVRTLQLFHPKIYNKNCFGFKTPCSMIFSSSIDEDQYYGGILLPVSGNLEELAVWSPGFQHPERHEILRHHCANH